MNLDEALEKARKLLRLSESDNPNEAALAATRAQEILDRYEIDKAMLEHEGIEEEPDDEPIVDMAHDPLDSATKFNLDKWRTRLAVILANNNMCKVYTNTSYDKKEIILVGRHSDARKVRYLFQFFAKEVDRLCDRDSNGGGRTWRNNYRHGVVDTLSKTIREERQESIKKLKEGAASTTLVKIDDALERISKKSRDVTNWMDANLNLRSTSHTPMTSNYEARVKGREAGKKITITKSKGALKE
jgi:hypothetical protein